MVTWKEETIEPYRDEREDVANDEEDYGRWEP